MTNKTAAASAAAAVAIFAAGVTGAAVATSSSNNAATTVYATPPSMNCNDWAGTFTTGECQSAGIIRYVALVNLQGAAQFCNWKNANPGEWSRLKQYTLSGTPASGIVTWLGASILNEIQAYFVTGAPVFTMPTNTAPNICGKGKLVSPPTPTGVTPGQTDATVTIQTTTNP